MTSERLEKEIELLQACYGMVTVENGGAGIIVPAYILVAGWSKAQTALMVLVPPGYATTPPDNFYTDVDLTLVSGAKPANTSENLQFGRRWRQFSYHLERGTWHPTATVDQGHNLITYFIGIEKRLAEVI